MLCLSEIIQSSLVKYKKCQHIETEENGSQQAVRSGGKVVWWFEGGWPPEAHLSPVGGIIGEVFGSVSLLGEK